MGATKTVRFISASLLAALLLCCHKDDSGTLVGKWKSAETVPGEYGESLVILEFENSGAVTMITDLTELDSKFISVGTFIVRDSTLILNLTDHLGEEEGRKVSETEVDPVEIRFAIEDLKSNGMTLTHIDSDQKTKFVRDE